MTFAFKTCSEELDWCKFNSKSVKNWSRYGIKKSFCICLLLLKFIPLQIISEATKLRYSIRVMFQRFQNLEKMKQ